LALSQTLVERGVQVVATERAPSAGLAALRERDAAAIEVHRADVCSEEQLAEVASHLEHHDVSVDAFLYNAAIHLEQERVDVEASRSDDVLQTLNVNAVGAVRAVKHLGRFVRPGGLLALISSEAGSLQNNWRPSEYGYCMSKAALNMFAQLLRVREQNRGAGVQVIALHPGWLRTDMGGPNADLAVGQAASDIVDTLLARHGVEGPPFIDRLGQAMKW
jgi:NAD(P)-dependent dehydrogenase (short-subunit alcohol dehydrogenase family)